MTLYKIKLLKQCDYFQEQFLDKEFFYTMQLHMSSVFFEADAEIIGNNEVCDQIIFIADGEVEVQMYDKMGKKYVVEVLKAGAVINQYGMYYNVLSLFTMESKADTKLMTLDKPFLQENIDNIDGLEYCIFEIE